MRPTIPLLSAVAALAFASGPGQAQDEPAQGEGATAEAAQPLSDEELIANAESAAPAAISAEAAVHNFAADGSMTTLREGTNGWWCMPDFPNTPGPDPMCGDANAMEWMMAFAGGTEPPEGKIGFSYMLAGGSDADNMDPFATEPPEGGEWVTTGPHVMIVNFGDTMTGYPEEAQPDPTKPFVMYPGTPYAHLMIPVE